MVNKRLQPLAASDQRSTTVVFLGASNLARGLSTAVETAQLGLGAGVCQHAIRLSADLLWIPELIPLGSVAQPFIG